VPDLVLAIFGPTASGKSAVAEALARRIPAELVSADSMQVYRGLPVLTNQSDHPTRLVGIWELDHEASVGEYQALAHAAIDEILAAGRTPVVVGGTGLYLRAALAELELPPAPPPQARDRLERLYDRVGAERAHELLAERDPAAAATVHPNDRKRIVRALELQRMGQAPHRGSDQLWSRELRRPAVLFGIVMGRDAIASRIRERAALMLEPGALGEVETALERGASRTARKAMGFKEAAAHLAGELELSEARALLERRHLAYAKRQLTWMRKLAGVELLDRTALGAPATARAIIRRLDSLPPPWESASRSGRRSATTT